MDYLISYVFSAFGLTVLLVWPSHGPSAWVRERLLRPVLGPRSGQVLDCYVCLSFWIGLACAPAWWAFEHRPWIWTACLMVPAAFWLALGRGGAEWRSAVHDEKTLKEELLP